MSPHKPTSARRWVASPPKPKIPASVQAAVTARAQALVDTILAPRYVREPPSDPHWNYIVGLSTRWYRSSLYFCATYCCPGPNALSPSFEQRFARMEFAGENRFHLAYMRHTGAWVVLYHDLPRGVSERHSRRPGVPDGLATFIAILVLVGWFLAVSRCASRGKSPLFGEGA